MWKEAVVVNFQGSLPSRNLPEDLEKPQKKKLNLPCCPEQVSVKALCSNLDRNTAILTFSWFSSELPGKCKYLD
jgi:hypothetical protein